MGVLPRVKASTKGEGHERRYFYGAVWASCVAQPVLGILWKLLPHTRAADAAEVGGILRGFWRFADGWPGAGCCPEPGPILPGELAISD